MCVKGVFNGVMSALKCFFLKKPGARPMVESEMDNSVLVLSSLDSSLYSLYRQYYLIDELIH